jgi:cytochrome b
MTMNRNDTMIKVWDPAVRVFHWALVAAFAIAWLTAEEAQPLHQLAGYAAAALVAFRLDWGITGTHYARFAQFVRSPASVVAYLRLMIRGEEPRYIGHNPAGAAMIVVLLGTLSVTAWTGWQMTHGLPVATEQAAPVVQILQDDDDHEDRFDERNDHSGPAGIKELHEASANLLLLLVLLHLGGVMLASLRHNENLARSMLTGAKAAPQPGDIA